MVVEAAMTEISISNESDVPLISFTLTKCNVIIVAHTYSMIFNNEHSLKWIWNSPFFAIVLKFEIHLTSCKEAK
jgi:hypothetical protein